MATRRRAPARNADPSGGNVLFTLGLVSVVALLIVGYVMTNGGITGGDQTEKDPDLVTIVPTATPVSTSSSENPSTQAGAIVQGELTQMQAQIDTLLNDKKSLETQLSEVKQKHQNEMGDLKMRIQILTDENNRLNKQLSGKS